jgi:mRNA interferase MazF
MKRGDVVVVQFPYVDGQRGKNRPAVIVQNDRENRRLANTVIAMVSGNVQHSDEPTQVLIDPQSALGNSSGLHGPPVVKCCNLYTVRQQDVQKAIGRLSSEHIAILNNAIRSALAVE